MALSTHLAVPPPMKQDGASNGRSGNSASTSTSPISKADDEVKLSLWLHLMGPEGIEVYNTF